MKGAINDTIYRDKKFHAIVFRGPRRSTTYFYSDDEDGDYVLDVPGELTWFQCAAIADVLSENAELVQEIWELKQQGK